jgi:L-ascorbate peroxidase
MLHKAVHVLPILSLSLLALAGPLEQRDPAPGIIEDILTGFLSGVAQLIKDVLSGAKSGIDDTKSNKPAICLSAIDSCCVCELISQLICYNI